MESYVGDWCRWRLCIVCMYLLYYMICYNTVFLSTCFLSESPPGSKYPSLPISLYRGFPVCLPPVPCLSVPCISVSQLHSTLFNICPVSQSTFLCSNLLLLNHCLSFSLSPYLQCPSFPVFHSTCLMVSLSLRLSVSISPCMPVFMFPAVPISQSHYHPVCLYLPFAQAPCLSASILVSQYSVSISLCLPVVIEDDTSKCGCSPTLNIHA